METKIIPLILFMSLAVLAQTSPCLIKSAEGVGKTNIVETVTYLLGEENLTESPAYSIQLFIDKDAYDPGDNVSITAYITGGGSINESRILGHVPESIIQGDANLTLFKFAKSKKGEWEGWRPVWPPEKFELPNRFFGVLSSGYFTYQHDSPLLWSEGKISHENETYPPISITFLINKNAPSGDHKIEFVFEYKSANGVWSISKETLIIHIRSVVEKYATGIALLLSAVITTCVTAIFWVLSRAR